MNQALDPKCHETATHYASTKGWSRSDLASARGGAAAAAAWGRLVLRLKTAESQSTPAMPAGQATPAKAREMLQRCAGYERTASYWASYAQQQRLADSMQHRPESTVHMQVRRLKMYSKTAKRDKTGKIIHQVVLRLSLYECYSRLPVHHPATDTPSPADPTGFAIKRPAKHSDSARQEVVWQHSSHRAEAAAPIPRRDECKGERRSRFCVPPQRYFILCLFSVLRTCILRMMSDKSLAP